MVWRRFLRLRSFSIAEVTLQSARSDRTITNYRLFCGKWCRLFLAWWQLTLQLRSKGPQTLLLWVRGLSGLLNLLLWGGAVVTTLLWDLGGGGVLTWLLWGGGVVTLLLWVKEWWPFCFGVKEWWPCCFGVAGWWPCCFGVEEWWPCCFGVAEWWPDCFREAEWWPCCFGVEQ